LNSSFDRTPSWLVSRLSNDGVEDDDELEGEVEGVEGVEEVEDAEDAGAVEGDVEGVVEDCAQAATGTLKTTRNDARQ
jgi:hypothetical protein